MLAFRSTSSSVKRKITDTFSRTVSGSLGTASSGSLWKNLRGTWGVSSSQASNSDSASSYPITTVNFLENANISADVSGGTGIVFWGTDANSWWASTVQYSTDSFSLTTCPGSPTSTCNSVDVNCTPSNCCSGVTRTYSPFSAQQQQATCSGGNYNRTFPYCFGSIYDFYNWCIFNAADNIPGAWGLGSCETVTKYNVTGTCAQPVSSSGTNYYSNIALISSVSGTVSTYESIQINTNTSALSQINSMKVTTSGNNISIQVFGTSGLLNKIGSTITRTITNPVKGIMVGLIKSPSSTSQGTAVTNFTAER